MSFLDGNGKFQIPKVGAIAPVMENKSPNYKKNQPYSMLIPVLEKAKGYLEKNDDIKKTLMKASGKTEKQLLKDFTYGSGPTVYAEWIPDYGWHKYTDKLSIRAAELYYAQEFSDKGNDDKADIKLTSALVTIIHEYLHNCGLSDEQIEKIERKLWGDVNTSDENEREDAIDNGQIPNINPPNETQNQTEGEQ